MEKRTLSGFKQMLITEKSVLRRNFDIYVLSYESEMLSCLIQKNELIGKIIGVWETNIK